MLTMLVTRLGLVALLYPTTCLLFGISLALRMMLTMLVISLPESVLENGCREKAG